MIQAAFYVIGFLSKVQSGFSIWYCGSGTSSHMSNPLGFSPVYEYFGLYEVCTTDGEKPDVIDLYKVLFSCQQSCGLSCHGPHI